jgi:cytochrome b pre-mRNA-processing protein 3
MGQMGALTALLGLRRRDRHERAGFRLYTAAVAAARAPALYAELGVPDTLDGRFDMVGLHAFLLIDRLRRDVPPGPDLAQSVFDAMFSDMDQTLREMGVGDLTVGKRVRAMWEAFHGRAAAYETALDAAEDGALAAEAMARMARAQQTCLAGQALAAFAAGEVRFRQDWAA